MNGKLYWYDTMAITVFGCWLFAVSCPLHSYYYSFIFYRIYLSFDVSLKMLLLIFLILENVVCPECLNPPKEQHRHSFPIHHLCQNCHLTAGRDGWYRYYMSIECKITVVKYICLYCFMLGIVLSSFKKMSLNLLRFPIWSHVIIEQKGRWR